MLVKRSFGGLASFSDFSCLYSGKKILLVTGKRSFEITKAKDLLEKHLMYEEVVQFSDFSVNPKIEDAVRGAEFARKNNIEIIVGVGGGSVLDMSKLIKAFYFNPGYEYALIRGHLKVIDPKITLIAIPTTAGSGSEATHFAVVYDGSSKYSLASVYLKPDAVLLDGNLTLSGDRYLRACNALDAMAQAIESFWAIGSTKESRRYSADSLELGWKNFGNYISGENREIVSQNMLEAANLAGQAIDISKTTAPHAWSYAFTSNYGISHGHAVWLTLPAVFESHRLATSDKICDPRGTPYYRRVIEEILEILRIDKKQNIKKFLQSFLVEIGIEYKMERLGVDTPEKRKFVAQLPNMERMQNNPVNLSSFTSEIFKF